MKLRYTIHPPQLVNRDWSDANQELQRFLKYLLDANDGTQTNIKELNEELQDESDALRRPAPAAHTHGSEDLLGLEPPYRRRPPSAHTHGSEDVQGLEPLYRRRPPDPHTHAIQDVLGSVPENVLESRRSQPHTHLGVDIVGGVGGGADPMQATQPKPHMHTEGDLINVVTVDNTGSPGLGLTLGDFILASQIFGG